MLRRLNLRRWKFKIAMFAVPSMAFLLSAEIELYRARLDLHSSNSYLGLYLLTTALWIGMVGHCQLSRFRPLRSALHHTLKANAYTDLLVLAFAFFIKGNFSRQVMAMTVALQLLFSFSLQFIFQGRRRWVFFQDTKVPRIAILGADRFASRLATRIRRNQFFDCDIAGFVALPGQSASVGEKPTIEWSALHEVVDQWKCQEVVLALPPRELYKLESLRPKLEDLYLPVRLALDFGRDSFSRERVHDIGGLSFVDVQTDPTDSISYAVAKRAFDLAFSTIALLAASPLMILIAALIKVSSPGPVLFRQSRVGQDGREFNMLKFRTMRVSSPQNGDTVWTTQNDPRRTLIGSLLRKSSLDELPQFFNVLMGDMSVVGPRPERPFFVSQFSEKYSNYGRRHTGKVGITGWAQINGLRGDTCIASRLQMDLHYLKNWSFILDIQIIALTVVRGVFAKNAY